MRDNRALPTAMVATTEVCRPVTGSVEVPMQDDRESLRRSRKQRRHGSELIEFSLVLLPFLAFMTLIVNLGWVVFVQSTLQNAVAQGGRYAITSQTLSGMNLRASVQSYVQQNSCGMLRTTSGNPTGVNGWNYINVDWYAVNSDGSLTNLDGQTGDTWKTSALNLPLVEVSVKNVPGMFVMQFVRIPGMGTLSPIPVTAVSWDRMGAPPIDSTGKITVPAQ
jgi:Flp pilus assembly protein TadG